MVSPNRPARQQRSRVVGEVAEFRWQAHHVHLHRFPPRPQPDRRRPPAVLVVVVIVGAGRLGVPRVGRAELHARGRVLGARPPAHHGGVPHAAPQGRRGPRQDQSLWSLPL